MSADMTDIIPCCAGAEMSRCVWLEVSRCVWLEMPGS